MKKISVRFFTAFVLLAALLLAVIPVGAASVTPVLWDDSVFNGGNPSCTDLGYTYGAKWNYPEDSTGGTFQLGTGSVTWSTDGKYVTWSSTFGVDAVLMKGGPATNEYKYNPESFGDSGLVSPDNSSGGPAGLSHVEFCYDYEVEVTKTAETSFTRTFTWEIDKSVDPSSVDLFIGDYHGFDYIVDLVKSFADSDFAVSGTISIHNPDPYYTATVTSVIDNPGGGLASVSCPAWTVAPGATLECTYTTDPRATNTFASVNTATVSTTGKVGGDSGTASIVFGKPTNIVGYETVNVTDSIEGDLGEFGDSGTAEYTSNYSCPTDVAMYTNGFYSYTVNNTATIDETGQKDSEKITVNCYAPVVSKDASTSYDRTYKWAIDKSADQTTLLLDPGQYFTVNYAVEVSVTGYDEDNFAAKGTITVSNPHPTDDMNVTLADVFQGKSATLSCNGVLAVPAKGSATCDYELTGLAKEDGTNVATATFHGVDFAGTADVKFGNADVTKFDTCVEVTDSHFADPLGTVCLGDAPKTFKYSLTFSDQLDANVVLECGSNTHVNIASFETNDNHKMGSDSWTVNADLACSNGCTLTPGYWKTHAPGYSKHPDEGWEAVGGPNATFFYSGTSYYNVLWSPVKGDPYYILAHAYIAAKLNIADGADTTPAVDLAMAYAESFFDNPANVPGAKFSKLTKSFMTTAASTLDQYNNGLIGPGHCSE